MKIELRWLTSWPGCFPCCCNCWLPRDQHPLAREQKTLLLFRVSLGEGHSGLGAGCHPGIFYYGSFLA